MKRIYEENTYVYITGGNILDWSIGIEKFRLRCVWGTLKLCDSIQNCGAFFKRSRTGFMFQIILHIKYILIL